MTTAAARPAHPLAGPARPAHPERVCWGCERRCPAGDLFCGEEKTRAPHPVELFGEDWVDWVDVGAAPQASVSP